MSDLEHLTQIINTVLGHDNQARKNSEALLKELREKDLNQYIFAFATLLKASPRQDVKTFCLVHMRRLLSDFVEEDDGKWDLLHGDTQKFVKETLLEILKTEETKSTRRVLCDFIGDLAASIQCMEEDRKRKCSPEGAEWNNLMEIVWSLLSSEKPLFMESSLRIMGVLFVHCGQNYASYKDELLPVFRNTIAHADPVVSVNAMEALSCYLENVHFKSCKIFMDLIPMMLSQTLVVTQVDEEHGLAAIGAIADILDTEPKMLKKFYHQLIEVLKTMLKSNVSIGLKNSCLETLILSVERLSKTFMKDQAAVKDIAEIVYTYMISAAVNPDEEWLSPPDGFIEVEDDDDSPDSPIRFGIALLDRVIRSLSKKSTLTLLSGIILEMVKISDWRYQHCALMSLSQVGEFIEELREFDPIVTFVLNFLQSEHPKVRYAALHCLGQMADDCKPAFQERYGENVLPAILSMFNDSVPRVVHHSLNATANFLEECPRALVLRYFSQILDPVLVFLQNGKSYIKESALLAIGNLAETCETDFTPYWQKTAEIIFEVLNNVPKEYKTVKGYSIETLSLIAVAVGREEFRKACNPVIQKMIEIQTNEVGNLDPQNVYIMSGWQRVCSVLEEDFIPYLNEVMPPIFKLVEDIVKAEEEKTKTQLDEDDESAVVARAIRGNEEGEKKSLFYSVNTSESDEVVTAVQMMGGFAEELKAGYLPYAEKTSDIFVYLLKNSQNEKVRKECANTFPILINVVKSSNHPDRETVLRKLNNSYLAILWIAVGKELDPEIMKNFVDVMMKVITEAGRCMNDAELFEFNECCMKTLKLSEDRKNRNQEYYGDAANNDEDYDEDDVEILDETNKLEEELHLALAELIGTLFKVYKEVALPLVKLIYTEILPKTLADDATPMLNKFGLFLIDDMIEHLGVELIPDFWPHLSEALLKYATHPHVHVRHAAVYGIGVLGEKSKDTFREMSDACMKVLYQCLEMPIRKGDDEDEFGSARDNIIASLGKIIKSQYNHINLKEAVKVWVNCLPLKYDIQEGKVQHELLVDIILESDAALIFGENGENLPRTIKVLAEVIDTKAMSEGFKVKVAKVIHMLAGNEATKALLQDAISKLDGKLQNKLKEVVEKAN